MARDDLLQAGRRAAEVLDEFRAKDRIKDGYTRVDPAQLASEADVTVMFRPLEKLLGGFLREEGEAGILVNVLRPRGLVHMTCAHELGHYFLGHESNTDETVDIGINAALVEQQANQFAYSLLAPRWLVITIMRMKGWSKEHLNDPVTVYQLSLRLGTSFEAMAWSLVRLGLLSTASATRTLRQQPKSLKLAALNIDDVSSKVPGDVWILNKADKDRIIEPASNDRFVLDLPNHAAAGHLWTVDELRCEGYTLEPFVQDARVVFGRENLPIRVGRLGAGTTMRYELISTVDFSGNHTIDDNRRSTISLHETAPWSQESEIQDLLGFSAEFDDLSGGLSRPERARRLNSIRSIE
ncbi:ImmA/IrrE family metallo-endopeptidase [Bordetella bronchiseptica]|uniref:ImmA/IrrE family metallo-endopeptidase n=2 Tax=Bordetella bronchiseptica TaxID=518 RepID=UPI0009B8E739|nr:ImmA/IrrE family metallo-endopeptidase [Bordetella bronchiseptica]